MGKVRDDTSASKATKATARASVLQSARRRFAPFVANLFQTSWYKPTQGWYARLWTGIGLGLLIAVGIYRLFDILKGGSEGLAVQFGVPAVLAAAFAWLIVRVLQYPPFADFLIATEAEMNKVSWTTKDDLYRATVVVLVTVLFLSVFLFVVDYLWSFLLQLIGVLKFDGGGGFGSTG
jgi:preprotein translocase subunit SecE